VTKEGDKNKNVTDGANQNMTKRGNVVVVPITTCRQLGGERNLSSTDKVNGCHYFFLMMLRKIKN